MEREILMRAQAINPARDFGPRLFSAIIYRREVFFVREYYCFVLLLAPVFGCLVGAVAYDSLLLKGRAGLSLMLLAGLTVPQREN